MNVRTIFEFQTGRAGAIRAVATSGASVRVGLVLVLTASIARNYDQTFALETPTWFLGSLLFSFISAGFFFVVVWNSFIRPASAEAPERTFWGQFRSFLGLFWMTAPIAWLYAIPVERFLNSYHAAQANLTLLAIVALWRVVLLARVFSVLEQVRFVRALGWVLLPACAEVAVLSFLGSASRGIMAGMGGLRNSPEEDLMTTALGVALYGAAGIGVLTIGLLAANRNRSSVVLFPVVREDAVPWPPLALMVICWCLIAIQPQRELLLNRTLETMLREERFAEALVFLSQHQRSDFAPAKRIAPDPYGSAVVGQLPELFAAMDGTEARWVRELYLDVFATALQHENRWLKLSYSLPIVRALERLPEGSTWVRTHHAALEKLAAELSEFNGSAGKEVAELSEALGRLGVQPAKSP